MTVIFPLQTGEEIDIAIIPAVIYEQTINKETRAIENYFILHPKLLLSFVGYNGALKLANQLSYNKKCGCFYTLQWVANYAQTNNINGLALSFSQQVEEYRYMIQNWYPSPKQSYMQYLSQIALTILLDIKQYRYYQSNNLSSYSIFQKPYYTDNFKNEKEFDYFLKVNYSSI
jgi:hypothetical protein